MTTINFNACIKSIMAISCFGIILFSSNLRKVDAADNNLAYQISATNTVADINFHNRIADQVKSIIYKEITNSELKGMTGTAAIIEVKYSKNGIFEIANVMTNNPNKIAATVHRKMVWKSMPEPGNLTSKEITAKMILSVDKSGEVQMKLEVI